MDIENKIICGDCIEVMKDWPDGSVSCSISSPPYWALRDYGVDGQLGLEKTFEEYIDKLCTIYDEVQRVLRKDGTCFVNLGDTYNAGRSGGWAGGKYGMNKPENAPNQSGVNARNLPTKSLYLIPQRFAIEMVNRGWILRNTLIWHKPNPMPSSVKDRFTVDFEYVYFFVKSNNHVYWVHTRKRLSVSEEPKPDYRWQHASGYELKKPPDVPNWKAKRVKCPDCKGTGKVRPVLNLPFFKGMVGAPEPCGNCIASLDNPDVRNYTVKEWKRANLWEGRNYWFEPQYEQLAESTTMDPRTISGTFTENRPERGGTGTQNSQGAGMLKPNPLGRNKRTVWTIPTQAFPEAHFATFPEKLVEPMIRSGCPEFICTKCGKPREKVFDTKQIHHRKPGYKSKTASGEEYNGKFYDSMYENQRTHTGYTDCNCGAEFKPGVVLDPFTGSGTTLQVAARLNRKYLGIELKREYIKMAERRIMHGESGLSVKEQKAGQGALF